MGSGGEGARVTRRRTLPTSWVRLLSLFVAFLGCVIVTVPVYFGLVKPLPLLPIGSLTVGALGGFLFVSL